MHSFVNLLCDAKRAVRALFGTRTEKSSTFLSNWEKFNSHIDYYPPQQKKAERI